MMFAFFEIFVMNLSYGIENRMITNYITFQITLKFFIFAFQSGFIENFDWMACFQLRAMQMSNTRSVKRYL
jgi:hypothetical protein